MVEIGADGWAEFHFFRPQAAEVFVAGDFNQWRTDQLRMRRRADGYWVLRLPLPAGMHRFRYVADGAWYTDFAASGVEPARFGMDSLLLVPGRVVPHPSSVEAVPSVPAAAAA